MIWSVATAAGALSINFATLLISRAMVGVGEAAYATIAPALLSDFYPPRQRNTVLSMFYMAIPIGAAMGYAIGGEIGGHFGWRVAFLVAGAPGLVVAGMCLAIKEPVERALLLIFSAAVLSSVTADVPGSASISM
jgi:MFS family permease